MPFSYTLHFTPQTLRPKTENMLYVNKPLAKTRKLAVCKKVCKKVCFVLWLEPERENTDPSLATLMLAGAPTPRMHSAAGSTAGAVPSRVAAMGRVPSSSQCRRFLLNGRRRRQPPPAPPPLPPPRRLVSAAVTLAPTL